MKDVAVTKSDVALKDFTACDRFDVMAQLCRIKAKVLVCMGDEDNITPAKYGEYLHQNISGSELAVISDAGHLSPIEKPEEVSRIIRDFMRAAL